MAKKSKIIFGFTILTTLVLFAGCANQLPPTGGDPDKTPPQVIEVLPHNGTINFHDNYFEITFSEYVEKRSVQNAIFISPALKHPLEYDWSGKSLAVYFKDTLKENTTYTVTIGTDTKDYNGGNKMAEAYTFAFSTGEKIDKGKLGGKVYDSDPDGVMIFAYRAGGKEIDPAKQNPDYISQVGMNGKFTLPGLGDGTYSIYAVRDKLKEGKYHKGDDDFGVQFKKVELDSTANELNDIDFFLTREDTIAPSISNVIMRDRNHLLVEFNDKIDSTNLSAKNFYLFDSTSNRKVNPSYLFKGDAKPYQFYIGLRDTLEDKEGWALVSSGVADNAGNISAEEKYPITVKNERDTAAFKLIRASGELPGGKIDYENSKIDLEFNYAADSAGLKERLTFADAKGNPVSCVLKRKDDAFFTVMISEKLKQNTEYTLRLNLKNYTDYRGNRTDSLYQNKFTTATELDFSGVSGNIVSGDSVQKILVLESAEKVKRKYRQKADEKNNFDFRKVVPGRYLIWGLRDENKNGVYDYGTITPFKFSEEFKYYPDTLNLRARWPVGGVSIDFKK